MKNFVSKSIILFVLFAFLGCSSDSLISCTPIVRKNGGTSTADCGCDCPTGYTGIDCSVQKLPSKLTISKIEIISFPLVDPSATSGEWDYELFNSSQNPPDIAIVITNSKNNNPYSNTSSIPFNNAKSGTTYTYNYPSFIIDNENINDNFIIELRDIDNNNTYQVMDKYLFSFYNALNNFPAVISLNHGDTKYKIYVSYTW